MSLYVDYVSQNHDKLNLVRPFYSCNVSGGKDSLFMLLLILKERLPLDEVITCSLEIENPIETRVKKIIKKLCFVNNIRFVELFPSESYSDLYSKFGKPYWGNLWCQTEYKQKALDTYYYQRALDSIFSVEYIGIATNESKRCFVKGQKLGIVRYPLIEFGYSEDFIIEWARKQKCFDGWYDNFNRLGCVMCPFRKQVELDWLDSHNYEYYQLPKSADKAR